MKEIPGTSFVVDFEEALRLVRDRARDATASRTQRCETVPLLASAGRVLFKTVSADRDQPPFDRSTRDGFAFRTSDWTHEGSLKIVGQIRAGQAWEGGTLPPQGAIEIMTGAEVPSGADAVVMVEHILRANGRMTFAGTRSFRSGENIVPRGSEARLGAVLLPAGTVIGAAEIALAATCGCEGIDVNLLPTIAIVATGDELVELDHVPGPQQIRNSNTYAIAAMVSAAGGRPAPLAIARDLRSDIRDRIIEGRKSDLMILSGGVSMGEFDLVEEVLAEFNAEFVFTGVRMQPGRPVVFGRLPPRPTTEGTDPECYFFGVPGNPISTQVTFHCFVEIFVRALAGQRIYNPRWAQATVSEAIEGKPGLTRLLPASLEGVIVTLTPWHGSGDLAANARANCYAELLPGRSYQPGDNLRVLLR